MQIWRKVRRDKKSWPRWQKRPWQSLGQDESLHTLIQEYIYRKADAVFWMVLDDSEVELLAQQARLFCNFEKPIHAAFWLLNAVCEGLKNESGIDRFEIGAVWMAEHAANMGSPAEAFIFEEPEEPSIMGIQFNIERC